MNVKKKFCVFLATVLLMTGISMIYTPEVYAQDELTWYETDKEEITWNKINDLNVITEYQGADGLVTYKYDNDGNRIGKEVMGVEYLYSYENEALKEEQFEGHVIKYISENDDGDLYFIGCEIDGVPYIYERDESNYIIGLVDIDGERVLRYEYDENGALLKEVVEGENETVIGLNHIIAEDKYWDEETGWYYYYKSYWNPQEKRFVAGSEKTVEEIISEYSEINVNSTMRNASGLYSQALAMKNSLLATSTYGQSISCSSTWYSGLSEVEVMARLIYGEAPSEDAQIKGVAWVLANRKESSSFASTYFGVCTQSGQFAAITGGSTNSTHARNPAITSERWEKATEFACILYVSNTKASFGTITGRPSGYVDQLYFLSRSYFDSKTDEVTSYAGGTGIYLRGETWYNIKDINHLGDEDGNVFFNYQ